MAIAKTVDVFTPIVDDPYTQGKIAACNSTSDIYAMGLLDVIGVLVIMGIPMNLPIEAAREMLRGFQDFCRDNETSIIGGHTILNPVPIIGGSVTGIGKEEDVLMKSGAKPNSTLILTKPLGNQTAMALSRVTDEYLDMLDLDKSEITRIVDFAVELMTLSNRKALLVLRELEDELGIKIANSMTDVTGFGILGHSQEMAEQSGVNIIIDALPIIKGTDELASMFGHALMTGKGAETAGGLLISVDSKYADDLIKKLHDNDSYAFKVGKVVEIGISDENSNTDNKTNQSNDIKQGKAQLSDDFNVINV
ncbi:selenide,water dikinase [Methanococcus voltae]|uniref:Selenide,water dikinase n=3 Tax=Methanococcus voltae TaxID=2188 RepID=A0A8J7UV08_METVO|nr:selenide,water dikinase [Methanococcus voltae]MBP2201901.1 selenide,water dikinase [Methanococcus voltae]MCS3922065.1 selenide,water dikinase [Methanococcus voltae PS]